MSRYRNQTGRSPSFSFNMTPLIDVTFLLLTYFMLASHFASAEKPDMKLPHPDDSQAVAKQQDDKVIINMIYHGADQEPSLTFGAIPVASIDDLAARLHQVAAQNPRLEVTLRADRMVPYGHVRRVMEAVAAANLGSLKVVAETDEGT